MGLLWVGMGYWVCLWGLGHREQGPPDGIPDTQLSRGSQGQGYGDHRCDGGWLWLWGGCSGVSEFWCMEVGHGMSVFGLRPRDHGFLNGNSDTHFPKGSQSQGLSGRRCTGDWLQICEGCSQDSWALLCGSGA